MNYLIPAPEPPAPCAGIHKNPCQWCPSAHYPSDPESLMYERSDKATRVAAAFPCAWRPNKLCKGVCDKMNLVENDFV